MPKSRYLLTAAAVLTMCPAALLAQDTGAEPNYETVSLEAGFPQDPYVVTLQSGGSIDASTLGDDCAGFIASSPDVRLNYEAGTLPLYFSATSDDDTTLAVNTPDGEWHCSDDDGGSFNPLVRIDAPQSGQYDIWVGTYADSTMHDAQLNISEINEGPEYDPAEDGDAPDIDYNAAPAYGTVTLAAGFSPDPYTAALLAGGSNEASQLGEPCVGTVASAPDFRLQYEAGSAPLYIRSLAEEDTTLAVNAPDGQWYCDDDGGGGLNALVWFDAPESGQYDIFVGTFSGDESFDATLQISEIADK